MKISEALGVTSLKLWKQGVFDSYLGIDSRLHLDPALLRSTHIPEFRKSLQRFENHFNGVLALIAQASPGSSLERQAINNLIFPEIPVAALGYSQTSTHGRGVTPYIASRLTQPQGRLSHAGIRDPAIFELAVIFEEKFGPDLISDMTLVVILEDINAFNIRVCKNLDIPIKASPFAAPSTCHRSTLRRNWQKHSSHTLRSPCRTARGHLPRRCRQRRCL